jgi:hypothetical protein
MTALQDGSMQPYRPARLFSMDDDGRMVATIGDGAVAFLEQTVNLLNEPLNLLYVLIEDDQKAGIYEAFGVPKTQALEVLREFRDFLEDDARHDFAVSDATGQGVMYDQHQRLMLAGDLATFEPLLTEERFFPGDVTLPWPHAHLFHPEFDTTLEKWLARLPWQFTPMPTDDEDDDEA